MLTNKDIRVDNGNIVINGDKYPLDGQSPETIMEIVEDNSDTTPTENSTAPITSGGVFTALGTKQDTLTFDSAPTDASANPVTSGGVYTADKAITDTIGDITQTGITGASVAAQLGSVHGIIDIINDLPPNASTTPADIPTGIRINFNIGSQAVGYPVSNALYVSIKVNDSRCVQILFDNGLTTPAGKYRTVFNSTTWSDWKDF